MAVAMIRKVSPKDTSSPRNYSFGWTVSRHKSGHWSLALNLGRRVLVVSASSATRTTNEE